MRLSVTLLGLDLFSIEISTEQAAEEGDCSRDLSGGTLGSDRIDASPTDRYMGFTLGLGGDDE